MNSITFEQYFSQKILTRGYDYYQSGQIMDLEQISETNWQAEVKGSSLYIVDVTLTPKGEPDYLDCDCPYEMNCKHIAAVLYAIREDLDKPEDKRKAKSQKKKPALKELLQQQTKEQLIELIIGAGKQHRAFLQEIELQLMPVDDVVAAAEKLISHHIERSKDRRSGFIAWGATEDAMEGIDKTHQRIEQCMEEGDYFTAFELAILCFSYAIDAFQYTDDSSGDIEYTIEESLGLIEQTIDMGADAWDRARYEEVFTLLSAEVMNANLDDWSSWRIALLRACLPLCKDGDIQGKFKELLQSLIKPKDGWGAAYMENELMELQFELISLLSDNEEVKKFLEDNLDNPTMRERVIASAMEQGDYEKVLELTEEGLKQGSAGRHIADQWRDYAFNAHKELGNKGEMRKLAHELIRAGKTDYLAQLKALYSPEEWPLERDNLLNDVKKVNNPVYATLIVEERQTARILDYCKEYPARVETYYSHIYRDYYEETCSLFIDVITKAADFSSDRKAYQGVCRSIQTMRKAGYKVEANNLIEDLLQTYPKRRAFVDELKKIS
ncbi:MAG: SWIM zinc finger domain-containing protein [Lysinibacillus sp.]